MTSNTSAAARTKIARNSIAGIGATLFQLITRLAVTPFVLSFVTLQEYGLWSFCFVILSYAGMSAFGVNNTYIKYTAEYQAGGDMHRVNGLLSTGLLCMGGLSVLFYLTLWTVLPWVLDRSLISPELRDLASFMVLGTAVAFLADLVFGAFRSVLEGLQEIALVRLTSVVASTVEILGIVTFLLFGSGIRGLLYAYLLKTVLELAAFMFLARRKCPGLRISPALISRKEAGAFFIFGGKVQFLGILGIFQSTLDRLFITTIVGLEATGLFEIARKFPFAGKSVSGAAFSPFLPAASGLGGWWSELEVIPAGIRMRAYGSLLLLTTALGSLPLIPWLALSWHDQGYALLSPWGPALLICLVLLIPVPRVLHWIRARPGADDRFLGPEVRELYQSGMRHIFMLNAVLFFFLAAIGPTLILAWVGPGYDQAGTLMTGLCLAYFFQQGTGPASLIFRGVNRSGRELEFVLVSTTLLLLWGPPATILFGLTGTVWAICATSIIACSFYMYRSGVAFSLGLKPFLTAILAPALIPGAGAVLVRYAAQAAAPEGRWAAMGVVVALGCLYVAGVVVALWALAFNALEKQALMRIASRILPQKILAALKTR